ncbi:threonine/serine ThrE exporter family protein [Liquorilactobacillus sicerae]|uniref:threonine/serine ThrE exporter family protein n=1 Tax=Liquorilactobacillus sicerae TaxID=1416943 RepID=UPI0024818C43|nr:threonine/serine exporter family protein [Liquorilactobacillus sicerae]
MAANLKGTKYRLSKHHHMTIHWKELLDSEQVSVKEASIKEKAMLVGRIGLLMLSCGTGAWRVREAMNKVARSLDLTCAADIGLMSIEYTCFSPQGNYSQTLSLPNTGVNTDKLNSMEHFTNSFASECTNLTVTQVHEKIDRIQHKPSNYTPEISGLAATLACCAFVFLLGGGIPEMTCSFFGAGIGNWTRTKLGRKKITTLVALACGVAVASLVYLIFFRILESNFQISPRHEAGYIGSMLFVIPGFPFITSFLDISKLDLRSGLERLTYALMITILASLTGWLIALTVHFKPENFIDLGLSPLVLMLLRLPASFCGVFGFSIMFNSTYKMAATAGCIGAIANTLRLELTELTSMPPATAAFCGALTAGLIASAVNHYNGYPRISLTVPSIVIMVPGLYIYRAVYNIGINDISVGALWLTKAMLIILFLPLGLFVARVLMDKEWRHFD